METFDFTKVEFNKTTVPEGAVSDEYVYVLREGDNITIGNRTSNCWVMFDVPRPNKGYNYWSGALRNTDVTKTQKIKYLSFRHRGNSLIIKYSLRVNKTMIDSEKRNLVLIIK
jgi:hypothetical protein